MAMNDAKNPSVRYDTQDIRPRIVLLTGAGILVGTLLTVFLLWFYFDWMRKDEGSTDMRTGPAPVFNELTVPRLQELPREDLQHYLDRQNAILRGEIQGVMPIEEAMRQVVQGGMPKGRDYSQYELHMPSAGHRQPGFESVPGR